MGMVLRTNDPLLFEAFLGLPGAPSMEELLARGWMQVDPEATGIVLNGFRPPALPANTGPLATSVLWLALMAARATENNADLPGHLSVAETLLVDPRGIAEPFLGDRRLLEFSLGPHVVDELVKRGADPTAQTKTGISCLESAIRRPEASPHTILGLAKLALPGGSLSNLPAHQRREMAEAVAHVFLERFPSRGIEWATAVAGLCGGDACVHTRGGVRLVDEIALTMAHSRQIDDNPLLVLEHLGITPAVAGQGFIGSSPAKANGRLDQQVPAWVVWEWLVLRWPGGNGPDDANRGVFCSAAGMAWTPAMMLPLVGKDIVDLPNQARLVYQALEHDPLAAMASCGDFFKQIAFIEIPCLSIEFDVGMMLGAIAANPALAHVSPEVAGTLAPWLALFDKPFPAAELDPESVLRSCTLIEAIKQNCKGQGDFLGKPRNTDAVLESLKSAAQMRLQTPSQDSAAPRMRF